MNKKEPLVFLIKRVEGRTIYAFNEIEGEQVFKLDKIRFKNEFLEKIQSGIRMRVFKTFDGHYIIINFLKKHS